MTQEETNRILLGYMQEAADRRLYDAITRGLYPSAWGCQWFSDVWARENGARCLRFWGDQATSNAIKEARL